jgi:hypothetical protein
MRGDEGSPVDEFGIADPDDLRLLGAIARASCWRFHFGMLGA